MTRVPGQMDTMEHVTLRMSALLKVARLQELVPQDSEFAAHSPWDAGPQVLKTTHILNRQPLPPGQATAPLAPIKSVLLPMSAG